MTNLSRMVVAKDPQSDFLDNIGSKPSLDDGRSLEFEKSCKKPLTL